MNNTTLLTVIAINIAKMFQLDLTTLSFFITRPECLLFINPMCLTTVAASRYSFSAKHSLVGEQAMQKNDSEAKLKPAMRDITYGLSAQRKLKVATCQLGISLLRRCKGYIAVEPSIARTSINLVRFFIISTLISVSSDIFNVVKTASQVR